jgi:hypothetical protein
LYDEIYRLPIFNGLNPGLVVVEPIILKMQEKL